MPDNNGQRCSESTGTLKNPENAIIPKAIGPIIIKIPEVDVKGCKPDNLVLTMCMLIPYNRVARTTQSACTLKSI